MPISMVVFDLGGVMIRICRSWSEACAAAGLPVRGESAAVTASGARHALAERHGVGDMTIDEFCDAVSLGLERLYSPREARQIHDAWLLGEYAGVEQLVHDVHDAGLETGILSNTNHAHWSRLGEFAGPSLIRHQHASHLLKMLKPGRHIYHEFASRTGFAGRESELLFFDDLTENVEAARSCGWHAATIDHTGDTAAQMRHVLRERGCL
jgi:glucose-1-phosphatase